MLTTLERFDVDDLSNERVEDYARQYAQDYDPIAAYVRTFGTTHLETAKERAGALLVNDRVRFCIEFHTRDRLQLQHVTRSRVLLELGRIAFADPRRLFDDEGKTKRLADVDEDTARAVAGFEPGIMGDKVKFASKIDALKTLAKIQGLIVQRSEVHAHVEVHGRDDEFTDSELDILAAAYGND